MDDTESLSRTKTIDATMHETHRKIESRRLVTIADIVKTMSSEKQHQFYWCSWALEFQEHTLDGSTVYPVLLALTQGPTMKQ